MITEDEALWAGIAVASMMLGGGFSMLFLQAYTGYGSVVLALGLMTMALTIQMRAKPTRYIKAMAAASAESDVLTPTPPVESPQGVEETQPPPEPSQEESKTEQPSSEEQKEPSQPIEQPTTEPPQPQPQAPGEEKTQPPETERKPEEEPIVVV